MVTGYLATFLWSLTPFLELRAAIPLGYLKYNLPLYEAVAISVVGVIFSVLVLLVLLPILVGFFDRHIPFFHRILQAIFARTRAKHSHRMEIVGDVFLIILVALPLPGSGGWTGALLAYLFGVKPRKALLLISTGVVLSGLIVAFLTVSGVEIWHFLNGFGQEESP